MRKSLIAASLLSLTVALAPACATKKFVRTEVGGVNSKVDTLSGTVEQTQGRIQQDEAKIGQVDQEGRSCWTVRGSGAEHRHGRADGCPQAAARADQVNTDSARTSRPGASSSTRSP